jgi:hypothetical protein
MLHGCSDSSDRAPAYADYVYKNAGSSQLALQDYKKTTDSVYYLGINDSMLCRIKLFSDQVERFIGSDSVIIFFDSTKFSRYTQSNSSDRNIIFHQSYTLVMDDMPKYQYTYTFTNEDYDNADSVKISGTN